MTIHNVSEHGLMLRGNRVPEQGTILEIQIGDASFVGEVRWSFEGKCGVRSREVIDVEALLSSGVLRSPQESSVTGARPAKVRAIRPEEIAERSRLISRLIDNALIIALVIVGAVIVAGVVSEMLGRPLRQIQSQIGERA